MSQSLIPKNNDHFAAYYLEMWNQKNIKMFSELLTTETVLIDIPMHIKYIGDDVFDYLNSVFPLYKNIEHQLVTATWIKENSLIIYWIAFNQQEQSKNFYGFDILKFKNHKIEKLKTVYYVGAQEFENLLSQYFSKPEQKSSENLSVDSDYTLNELFESQSKSVEDQIILQQKILKNIFPNSKPKTNQISIQNYNTISKKYNNSGLTKKIKETLAKEIIALMEDKKLYLNSELRISDIANLCNTSTHFISETINDEFNYNYHAFVNSYRIDHAKTLLKSDKTNKILEIALSSGFNSSSSFYYTFKKNTALSPRMYRSRYFSSEN